MSWLRTLLIGNGMWAAVAAFLVAFGGWRWFDVSKQRSIGEQRAVAKIEKATKDVVKKADAAGRKSVSGAGGVRNPHYRD